VFCCEDSVFLLLFRMEASQVESRDSEDAVQEELMFEGDLGDTDGPSRKGCLVTSNGLSCRCYVVK
jgi:hypothetical protein